MAETKTAEINLILISPPLYYVRGIPVERKVKRPTVVAIAEAARAKLFE